MNPYPDDEQIGRDLQIAVTKASIVEGFVGQQIDLNCRFRREL